MLFTTSDPGGDGAEVWGGSGRDSKGVSSKKTPIKDGWGTATFPEDGKAGKRKDKLRPESWSPSWPALGGSSSHLSPGCTRNAPHRCEYGQDTFTRHASFQVGLRVWSGHFHEMCLFQVGSRSAPHVPGEAPQQSTTIADSSGFLPPRTPQLLTVFFLPPRTPNLLTV